MHTLNSWQTLLRFGLSALLVGGMAVTAVNAVDGNPPGLFELDGNTVDADGGGDDWNSMHPNNPLSSVAFTGILADKAPLTIFTGGGSKDILDIPNWRHTNGAVPDKDDITNAYAAAYINPDDVPEVGTPQHKAGDMIIYFGLDRFANNGDAHAAFWFFQNDVGLNPNGTFKGQHVGRDNASGKRGDLMVLVEYPQGANAVPEIKVYEWDPLKQGNVVADNLSLLYSSTSAKCDGTGNKLACATTNAGDLPLPAWPYAPKLGAKNRLPKESFFEGGVNVSALLGGNVPCFSSFLAETRSSRSETAQLKDFVLGDFNVCAIAVTKSCEAAVVAEGDTIDVSFDGKVTNTGALPLFNVRVKDDMGTPSEADDEYFKFLVNGSEVDSVDLAPGEEADYSGSYTTTSMDFPLQDTVTVTGERGQSTVSDTADAECTPTITPEMGIETLCEGAELISDGTQVRRTYSVTVTNTGNIKLEGLALEYGDEQPTPDETVLAPNGGSTTATLVVVSNDLTLPGGSVSAEATAVLGGTTVPASALLDSSACPFDVAPVIAIEKTCESPEAFGEPIKYMIKVRNNGLVQLVDVTVDDDNATPDSADDRNFMVGTLNVSDPSDPDDPNVVVIEYEYTPSEPGDYTNTAIATGYSVFGDDQADIQSDSATCTMPPPPPPGEEGCTPGFWKNSPASWVGYSPDQTVGSVFNVPGSPGNLGALASNTLMQALNYGGGDNLVGSAQILLRAAVASVLNAAHPDTDFPRTAAAVIADVNAALATKDRGTILALATALDADNNLGCDLPNDNSF